MHPMIARETETEPFVKPLLAAYVVLGSLCLRLCNSNAFIHLFLRVVLLVVFIRNAVDDEWEV